MGSSDQNKVVSRDVVINEKHMLEKKIEKEDSAVSEIQRHVMVELHEQEKE